MKFPYFQDRVAFGVVKKYPNSPAHLVPFHDTLERGNGWYQFCLWDEMNWFRMLRFSRTDTAVHYAKEDS